MGEWVGERRERESGRGIGKRGGRGGKQREDEKGMIRFLDSNK